MVDRKPLVPIVVGPTAVGKTAVVTELAHVVPIVVISADSRQAYCGLDVGTAKPSVEVRQRVPHVGIDLVRPGEHYSAGRFYGDVKRWLAETSPDRQPVVVGGTGFYIRAITEGLFEEPALDAVRVGRLRDWARRQSALERWATRLDPAFSGDGGTQRVTRALEVALLTGRPLSWWQAQCPGEGILKPWFVVLTLPRPELHRRITERVTGMLERGFIDEVQRVLEQGVPAGAPGLDAVGYREVVHHLRGHLSEEALAEAIVVSTRQYAKRQETWFRHQLRGGPIMTLEAAESPRRLAQRIFESWEHAA